MKIIKETFIIILLFGAFTSAAQKVFPEGTLVYTISVLDTGYGRTDIGATATFYIKENMSRAEMVTVFGSEATLHDSKTGAGTILKDYSGQRVMIPMTHADCLQKNSKYEGITFDYTEESLQILGYNCKKAIARLKDGSSFVVYYIPELDVSDKEYEYEFKTLRGLPARYEWLDGKKKYVYSLSKINFDPVASSRFDIPRSGYRLMNYAEAIKK